MTTTLLRLSTKSDRLTAAEFTTRTWRWHSDTVGSARCTFCGIWVPAVRLFAGGEWEKWASALEGSMLQHLEDHGVTW